MSDWTTIIRAALTALLGSLGLAASFCTEVGDAQEQLAEPIVASVSDQPARAQISDEPGSVTSPGEAACPAVPLLDPGVSAAIQNVRRAQGSMLEGTLLQSAAAPNAEGEEFSSALQRVAREADITPTVPVPLSPLLPSNQLSGAAAIEGSTLLRQAARELELRAADQEDLRQFEEADRLRRLATRLRREARHWDERAQLTGSMYY